MLFEKINNRLNIIVPIMFLLLPLCIKAQTATSIKHSNYFPSTIELNQTSDTIFVIKNGNIYMLPKVEKKKINKNWITNNNHTTLFQEGVPLLKEMQEMLSLSGVLGFRITDPKHLALYREAASWIGTRYRWAGSSKKGVDCSGLTNILFKTVYDKDIDRTSFVIADRLNEELEKEYLEPGDLVFFSTMRKKRINHVGVYLGQGHFIHASRRGVVVSSLDDNYYARALRKAGRI